MFLCLYNSYDKLRVHDIHIRSVARAAPVCYALGFHLVLLDFPEPMYDLVVNNTTIGESGKYLEALKVNSKFSEFTKKFPLATLVVTTSRPDSHKQVGCKTLVNLSRDEPLAFIIGLGRRGLPNSLRKKAKYHWDCTGKGISLETCTAIGYIAARFATMLELKRTIH
ncbi:MAG: hypothetical protein AYK19_05030 [Theionarchaea archaeon DG-70-1]|nr:MAG: hypothetical protein AYK19_05030 [Theionarchaea archaeon DG-70-1]